MSAITDSQRQAALDRANAVRNAHVRLHRELQSLNTTRALWLAVALLRDRDEDAMTLRLTQLIGWIPALGKHSGQRSRSRIADELFEKLGVTVFDRRIGELTDRQRAVLAVEFEKLAGGAA